LFLLKRFAWGPMLEGLVKREENIRAALDEAKAARDEAAGLRAHLAQERARIADEIRKALDEAREDGRRLVEEMQAKAKSDIQADRDRLRREIETARDQALHEIWNQAANLATQISAKVIRREVNGDDHRRLIDEAMNELNAANTGWKDRTLY
jgi:F-type H+-transporting ATPase subunit b